MALETAPQTQKSSAGPRIFGVLVGSELWSRFTEQSARARLASGRNPTAKENLEVIGALREEATSEMRL